MSKFGKQLTVGCIKAIIEGENCENPVVQLLRIKEINYSDTLNKGYRLIIWDGEQCNLSTYPTISLNDLFTKKTFEAGAIIRLDKYVRREYGNPIERIIVLFKITVLVPGNMVSEVIFCSDDEPRIEIIPLESLVPSVNVFAADSMADHLTLKCIRSVVQFNNIECPVVQYLDAVQTKFSKDSPEFCYRLLLWDGSECSPQFVLATFLNDMINNQEIKPHCIIRLEECKHLTFIMNSIPIKFVFISKLSVLIDGDIVGGLILPKTVRESAATEGTQHSDGANNVKNRLADLILDSRTSKKN